MSSLVVVIDAIHGEVKITAGSGDQKHLFEFKWCSLDDEGYTTGFLTSFSQVPVRLTEVAAEQFLRVIVAGLIQRFALKPGALTIINHMGETIPDVQFLPPTFDGDEQDVIMFVAHQDSLVRLYSMYEEQGELESELLSMAEREGIVDDFLNLVHLRGSGIFMAVSQPNQ